MICSVVLQDLHSNSFFMKLITIYNDRKLSCIMQRSGIFFVSGDVHFGEIARYDCGGQYPLYDITSSGLTQAIEKVVPSLVAIIVRVLAWLTPTTMRVKTVKCRFRSCIYGMIAYIIIFKVSIFANSLVLLHVIMWNIVFDCVK